MRKNAKHSHTVGAARKSNVPPAFFASGSAAVRASSSVPRFRNATSSASTPTPAAAMPATRQFHAAAIDVSITGATAQPRLPDSPWTENAWPRRGAETRRLSSVKSTGWNTELPRPARKAAARSIAMLVDAASSSPEAMKRPMPP